MNSKLKQIVAALLCADSQPPALRTASSIRSNQYA